MAKTWVHIFSAHERIAWGYFVANPLSSSVPTQPNDRPTKEKWDLRVVVAS